MKHYFAFLTLVAAFSISFNTPQQGTHIYPQGFFQSPVGHSLRIAGTFGELRPNHFHAGIDISPAKSGSAEPIYAAAEGYVSRIKISSTGYGNALYIAHPNGFTTLYAHLLDYADIIEDFVRTEQYKSEKFDIDITLQTNQLPIAKGQQIGLMGTTGASLGVHLHFEIRDSQTEEVINPFLFGIMPADNIAPTMQGLKMYLLDEKNEVLETRFVSLSRQGNTYMVAGDTLSINAPKVAFALKTFDTHNGESGTNGVYSIETQRDGATIHHFKAERFRFDESRYLNAHIDYEEHLSRKTMLNRLWRMAGNQLSMYESEVNAGIIGVQAQSAKINVTSKDLHGNAATLVFFVKQNAYQAPLSNAAKNSNYQYVLPVNQESVIKNNDLVAYFPKNTLYENLYMRYQMSDERGNGQTFSSVHHLHDYKTPAHAAFKVGIMPTNLPDNLRSKAYIAYCRNDAAYIYSFGGKWDSLGYLVANANRFGNFCVMTDLTPPNVAPISMPDRISPDGGFSFRATDNIDNLDGDDIYFRATIDGKWALMEFDRKNNLLRLRLENRWDEGKHDFKLVVTDHKGNEKVIEKSFEIGEVAVRLSSPKKYKKKKK